MLIFSLSGCGAFSPAVTETVFTGPIMGTDYRIVVRHTADHDPEQIEQTAIAAMASVNASMSTYLDDSEISRFNQSAAGIEHTISEDFRVVLAEALEIAALTQGAFDPTIGPVVNAWGFGPQGKIVRQPTDEALAALRDRVGYEKVTLVGNRLSKRVDNVYLDLSAIAKGFAVDKVAEELLTLGINDFLVNIGGELRGAGLSGAGHAWRVGVEKPQVQGGVQQIVTLTNASIATSGDYRNFVILNGQHYSHTISPVTFKPVLQKLASVSVLSERCSTADALATALLSMGETQAKEFVRAHKIAAYMLVRSDQSPDVDVVISPEFEINLR
ncbi:FAD:protein FMN transferase [Arenicella chitinivorans]|nr:FAD:protein FMN transferase [Arenicella chitinivorans]